MDSSEDADKDCGIIIDEMAIEEIIRYDPASQQEMGKITLGDSEEMAKNGLVFMVAGIWSRWKQVVGYHLTGDSIAKGLLKPQILDIVQKAENIGLRIHFVTSDCGACNKRMWADFGISTSKSSIMQIEPLQHPTDPERHLEFIPDPVHVYKSAVRGWINNRVILLGPTVENKPLLEANVANIDHLTELVNWENSQKMKPMHGLTLDDVNFTLNVSSVEKMKVINSWKYVNTDVASSLEFMAQETGRNELLATARFIRDLAQ